jgi:hypothetical protein
MTGWLFPLRPRQQSQIRDSLRLLPPSPCDSVMVLSPRGEGYRCPKIVRITRGSELPGSGSPKERSDEEALGYRIEETTNSSKLTDTLDENKSEVQTWSIPSRLQAVRLSAWTPCDTVLSWWWIPRLRRRTRMLPLFLLWSRKRLQKFWYQSQITRCRYPDCQNTNIECRKLQKTYT